VQQSAANVDVATRAIQQKRNAPIHHHPSGGHPHHQPGMHLLRMLQTPKGFVEDEKRNYNQRTRIHQCREHSRSLVAERLGGIGGTRLKIHRDQ
jgi:hypothetical protein